MCALHLSSNVTYVKLLTHFATQMPTTEEIRIKQLIVCLKPDDIINEITDVCKLFTVWPAVRKNYPCYFPYLTRHDINLLLSHMLFQKKNYFLKHAAIIPSP